MLTHTWQLGTRNNGPFNGGEERAVPSVAAQQTVPCWSGTAAFYEALHY
jgi:hypothetical protein